MEGFTVTIFQKAALSLLIAVFFLAGLGALVYTGLFNILESRFYNPSIKRALIQETGRDAEIIGEWIFALQNRFASSLNDASVRRSFLPGQSADDIYERSKIYGRLQESVAGLYSVRFVDSAGLQIHFSTYQPDIVNQDSQSISYRGYNDDNSNVPFDTVDVAMQGKVKLTFDEDQSRIIFSFPFYDSLDVYCGVALFAVSAWAVPEQLAIAGRTKPGEDVLLAADPPGMVFGFPGIEAEKILAGASSIWKREPPGLAPLVISDSGAALALVSAKTVQGFYYGRIVNEDLFTLPRPMRIILPCAFFLTIYLAVFLCLNLGQDPIAVIQNRLRRLQLSLIKQFHEHRDDLDWINWTEDLEQRREDIRAELKRGLKIQRKDESDIDCFIDAAWDELLAIGGRSGKTGASKGKSRAALEQQPVYTLPISPLTETAYPAGGAVPAAETGSNILTKDWAAAAEEEKLEELEVVEDDEDKAALVEVFAETTTGGPGLLATASKRNVKVYKPAKQSNVRLAFGTDNIPCIAEASGLEPVNNPIEETSQAMHNNEDDEIEELEEVEELEELEQFEEAETPGASPPPESSIEELASEIEFSPLPETEEAEEIAGAGLEVVSPFTSLFSSFGQGGAAPDEAAELESLVFGASHSEGIKNYGGANGSVTTGFSIIPQPFLLSSSTEPELLPAAEGKEVEIQPLIGDLSMDIITEQNGVHYINANAFNPDKKTEEKLDNNFRTLVESVVGR
ncbi:MAG: hypothetical protein LBD18_04190 [Treponema sp.]|jgi:hypothetical protein|nr:hypothetical protein [Treponema sp.]